MQSGIDHSQNNFSRVSAIRTKFRPEENTTFSPKKCFLLPFQSCLLLWCKYYIVFRHFSLPSQIQTMQVISTWDTCQKSMKSKKAIISINHRIVTLSNNQFHTFLNLAPSPPNNVETAQRDSTLNLIYHLI